MYPVKMKNIAFIFMGCLLGSAHTNSQSCQCFAGIDGTFHIVPMTRGSDTGIAPDYRCNHCSSQPIALPFEFCFYGTNYDTVYINNKGNISFGNPDFNFSTAGFQAGANTRMLAAFWADIDNTASFVSEVYYKITPTRLIVQWDNVGYQTFDDDDYNSFQLIITNGSDSILPSGNNVSYCYSSMQWASADSSGGFLGFEGAPAIVGVNKGNGVNYAQIGAFDLPGNTYHGPFDTSGGVFWLTGKSFAFNTCVPGNEIPPVIADPAYCNRLTVCAGDTLFFDAFFICPQQGQTATLSVSVSGISGLTSSTGITDSIYIISTQLIAALSDTGAHTITLTATDNSTPPLTNTMPYIITIANCDSASGIHELAASSADLIVYPNPNSKGVFTFACHSERSEESLPISINIYNALGEKVLVETPVHTGTGGLRYAQDDNLIDLTEQPNGIYFYRIITESGNLLGEGKIIIEK